MMILWSITKTRMWRLLVLSSCLSLVTCEPKLLGDDTFQPSIDSGKPHFVKFFAPWCGHCKRLAPTWDELSNKFIDNEVIIAKVDCTVDTQLCAEYSISGYPTLKLFVGSEVKDYRGSRDIDSLMEFLSTNIKGTQKPVEEPVVSDELVRIDENGLAHLTDENFATYLSTKSGLHFIKFYAPWCGHCQRLAPTWDELAAHFESNEMVHISKVDCTMETEVCTQRGIKGYPTLLLFVNGEMKEKYTDKRDLEALVNFVERNVIANDQERATQTGVLELTADTFSDQINHGTTFVKFYAPWCGHCKRLAPTWAQLAELIHATSEAITIAKVDCTAEGDLCANNKVHSYPTLVLFNLGEKTTEYRGARDLESLEQFLAENTK